MIAGNADRFITLIPNRKQIIITNMNTLCTYATPYTMEETQFLLMLFCYT